MIKVRPISRDHSIKEAVISTFLAAPLIKPERFRSLIDGKFKELFHQFEPLKQLQFQLKSENGLIQNSGSQIINDTGFRFSAFKNGKLQKVLQAANEETRYYISYHTLCYNRWNDFFEDYLSKIRIILDFHPGLFINGISLHYIDEFEWQDPQLQDLGEIFEKDCSYIPNSFFDSLKTGYTITMEQSKSGMLYYDRLEIKVDPGVKPFISISHNITQPFTEPVDFLQVIESKEFNDKMMAVHLHNKDILRCLLKENIKKLINLQ